MKARRGPPLLVYHGEGARDLPPKLAHTVRLPHRSVAQLQPMLPPLPPKRLDLCGQIRRRQRAQGLCVQSFLSHRLWLDLRLVFARDHPGPKRELTRREPK